jgi:glutathione S-transferase
MTGEGLSDAVNPHPDKRVPAILRHGALITESAAIVLYLTDAFPAAGLGPASDDPRRGECFTWIAWYATELQQALFAGLSGELAGSPQKQRNHDAVVSRLRDALARSPYMMGDVFTAADLLIGSALGLVAKPFRRTRRLMPMSSDAAAAPQRSARWRWIISPDYRSPLQPSRAIRTGTSLE